jgi:alpha-beta hydrolase superfamily lysophospholipase
VDVSLENGYAIARVNAWNGEADTQHKTYEYYQSVILEAIEHLQTLGYASIIAIGKSFGGGLLLSVHHNAIVKKILWAPAVGCTDTGNLDELKGVELSHILDILDIKLSTHFVSIDKAQLCFIHGTDDTVVPVQSSRNFAEMNSHASIIEVPGADHSFRSVESERALIEATGQFLKV